LTPVGTTQSQQVKTLFLLSLSTALLCAAVPAFGQAQAASPAPLGTPNVLSLHDLGPLTPEERTALDGAREKAQRDPRVRAAAARMRKAEQALDAAMVAQDKSLRPILDKAEAAHSPGSFHIRLTGDEREELRVAREALSGSPEEDALQKARDEYHKTAADVMTEGNPSMAAIIERLPQGWMEMGVRRDIEMGSPSPSGSASPGGSP
jgi:hypothetical protein